MKKKYSGIDKGLTNYGDQEFSKFLRRSFAKSMGYTNKSLNKPIVGICYTESGFNNCHRNFPDILQTPVHNLDSKTYFFAAAATLLS